MRTLLLATAAALSLSACKAPEATITGSVDGHELGSAATVVFGECFIAIAADPIDCLNMYWVSRHYSQGEAVTDFNFQALQFAYDDPQVTTGIFNVAGEAAVSSKFLVQEDMAFSQYLARGGDLTVDYVDEDWVEGSFSIQFDEGSFEGDFVAQYCRNLKDN